MSSEFERIAALARTFGMNVPSGVRVGIGDDAAILDATGSEAIVWTVDAQVEGQHWRRDLVSWRDLGWRSFMAAASDIAAMGARAWCALSSLVLPIDVDDAALAELALGQREAADATGCAVVGGNLARGTEASVTTTLLGRVPRPIERRGARAGDGVYVAGAVGLAAAGLRALLAGIDDARVAPAIAAWRRPRARLDDGARMASVAHAAIDVSDGLAQDAGHVAEASGVAIVLDEGAILAHGGDALRDAAAGVGASALDLALHGGEDYALVVASPVAIDGFARLGDVIEGKGVLLRAGGATSPIEARGWDHFR